MSPVLALELQLDELGRVVANLTSGASRATVTSSAAAEAIAGLAAALDDTAREGCGECYWPEGGGDYRWLFRRKEQKVAVVVLWCSNPVTGWEHIFWTETAWEELEPTVRSALARHSITIS
jgi:hypothetical protein